MATIYNRQEEYSALTIIQKYKDNAHG